MPLRVAGPPLRASFGHPRLADLGWPKPPHDKTMALGWSDHQKAKQFFFEKIDLAVGGGRSTPKGQWGGFGHPRPAEWGWSMPPHDP